MNKYDEIVARGADLLNRKGPAGWIHDIDTDKIDIMDPRNCMIAQSFKSVTPSHMTPFSYGILTLKLGWEDELHYGFLTREDEEDEPMKEAWVRYIEANR